MKTHHRDIKSFKIDDGIYGLTTPVNGKMNSFHLTLERNEILWLSCLNQHFLAKPSFMPHVVKLAESESMFLAFPRDSWEIEISDQPENMLSLVISLTALHDLIEVNFDENKIEHDDLDYTQISKVVSLSPKVMADLSSLFTGDDISIFKGLQRKGKFLSAFSAMMEKLFGKVADQCPFQMDRKTEQKIRSVRNMIVNDLSKLPDTQTLSFTADIPKSILKQGFKHLYGKSIYNFYNDYRMDKAESLLESGQHLVKEIAFEIGYQNPSHFIAAFKKRNGCTPKQYMKNY